MVPLVVVFFANFRFVVESSLLFCVCVCVCVFFLFYFIFFFFFFFFFFFVVVFVLFFISGSGAHSRTVELCKTEALSGLRARVGL